MFPMNHSKRWMIAPPLPPSAQAALAAFPPVLQQLLYNRGYASASAARAYLQAEPPFSTDPYQMLGMEHAVARIRRAINDREAIAIYGDYDVDGVTATALLVQTLHALHANVRPYIPNRFEEGYGLNKEALATLRAEGISLLITVDCGIRSQEEAHYARQIGLDLIITDHHTPAETIPPAVAVLNPKQPEDPYPDKDLAGVGIAYKLAQALLDDQAGITALRAEDFLDLVALGTVADLAPLTGENRALVRQGLREIAQTRRQGLFSLAAVAEIPLARVSATTIGYILGPRLNAAGRLDTALAAYELLTTSHAPRAAELAQQLNLQNRQRQELTRKIQEEAEALALAKDPQPLLLFAVHPEFNPGVVGLAAARLVEKFYRPAIVGQMAAETTRCSCRSIPEFHITQALDRCQDLLLRHGGHASAAGFTVRNENLAALQERLQAIVNEQLSGQDLKQTLYADAELPLAALKPELLQQLEALQPTGYGNPEAVFVTRNVRVTRARTVGSEGKHLKLTITDGWLTFDAIGFQMGPLADQLPGQIDILYTFEVNEYNGRSALQLNLRDLRPAGSG
jgi:single-stranded-DNA-specific exonuclease